MADPHTVLRDQFRVEAISSRFEQMFEWAALRI